MPSQYLMDRKSPLLLPNPDFQGTIAANAKLVARIPIGPTYLGHWLNFTIAGAAASTAQIQAQIANIRFLVDAEVKFEMSGTEAIALAEFYRTGSVGATGFLPVRWNRPWMELLENQDAPAYGMLANDTFTCEVTFAAAGITIDSLKMTNETVEGEELGAHIVTLKQFYNFGSTGIQEIIDLPRNPLYRLYAFHITPPSGGTAVLTNVELLAENAREIFATPGTINRRYAERTSPRTPQATWYHVDFAYRNRHIDSIPLTMNDLRLRLTWGTAAPNNFSVMMEQYRIQPSRGVAK